MTRGKFVSSLSENCDICQTIGLPWQSRIKSIAAISCEANKFKALESLKLLFDGQMKWLNGSTDECDKEGTARQTEREVGLAWHKQMRSTMS